MGRPRVVQHLTDVAGKFDTLDKLLAYADTLAQEDQDMRGQARFLFLLAEGSTLWVMETPWDSEPEKRSHIDFIRMLLEAHPHITAYASIHEMWARVKGEDQKKSALLIAGFSRDGEEKSKVYTIDYAKDGKAIRTPAKNFESGRTMGYLWNLFRKREGE